MTKIRQVQSYEVREPRRVFLVVTKATRLKGPQDQTLPLVSTQPLLALGPSVVLIKSR